jgi:abhydrolase domain-containing protein 6
MNRKTKLGILIIPLVLLSAFVIIYLAFPGVTFSLLLKVERGLAGFEQHSVVSEGLTIEYLEGGQGPVLLLLHGFGANKDNWTRIGRHLTPHFRVIAPDLPGFGESTHTSDIDYRYPAQVQRLKAFVSALDIKSFHIGGNSMGGNIAGRYTAMCPADVISLWLIAPGGVASAEPSEMARMLNAGEKNPLIAQDVKGYEQLLDFVFVKRPFIPRAIKQYLVAEAVTNRPLNQKIFEQIQSDNNGVSLEKLVQGLQTPTLILWGDRDRVLHVSGAKILESVIPDARVVILEGVGHVPMVEKPKPSADAFIYFQEFVQTGEPG